MRVSFAGATMNASKDTDTPARTRFRADDSDRSRSPLRPWLLLLLLAALIALLASRPELRRDAAASARSAVFDGLNIAPRRIYAWRLWLAGLDDSALGRRWTSAVERAGADPIVLGERYRDTHRFAPDTIEARVFRTTLERGRQLALRVTRTDDGRDRIYASVEHRSDGDADWSTVASVPTDGTRRRIMAEVDGDYRVVLQPELAADVAFTLAAATGGSLAFPVEGAAERDIGSGFGAPRDGGTRDHHGVDIFAARGTPVLAVADGRVRTGTEGIGGNHVWLSSGMLGIGGARYYYAHLDAFEVESGDSVAAGDVLGTVGNTGNARTTPPHLHFGIYLSGGPVDPAPFLGPPPRLPAQ